MKKTNIPPLITHIIYRLAVGGMENGLVNLINNMPEGKYRHTIICMDDYTDFRFRIKRKDVEYYALHKNPGHDLAVFYRLFRLLRRLQPAIVHTRNIGTLECMFPALMAGVPVRIHGEHGRDMTDIDGTNKKYIYLRKVFKPVVHRYVAVSRDLEKWLLDTIGVEKSRLSQIYNGVDIERFAPHGDKTLNKAAHNAADNTADNTVDNAPLPAHWYQDGRPLIIGTVGRLQGEKDQMTLVHAFHRLLTRFVDTKQRLCLAIIGDGPMRGDLEKTVKQLNIQDRVWLSGSRDDIAQLLSALDIFVLPSKGEGISNTILEAMASGLPVVATNVGGNPELVADGGCGRLVPSEDPDALAQALAKYVEAPMLIEQHGEAARRRVESLFSLPRMVESYLAMYDSARQEHAAIKLFRVPNKNN